MNPDKDYSIHTDIKFRPLELIDIPALVEECPEEWYNQTLCQVNDSVVRLGIIHGDFHWHKHEREDEFFYVVDGCLMVDLEGETVELGPKQGFTIPKGVRHRTRAPERTVILMVEASSVIPTGD